MSCARFDDGFPQHPKVVGLSDQAFRLHVAAVCYANQNLTDGVIHGSQLPLLLHGRPLPAVKRKAQELLDAGVWEASKDGCYQIHDFLIYNKPRSEVLAKRQKNAKAGAKGAASRWHSNGNSPDPDPRPDPGSPKPTTVLRGRSARQLYEHVVGRPVGQNKALRDELDRIQDEHGVECMAWAFEQSIGTEKPWPYARKILSTCAAEGHGPRGAASEGELDDFDGRA